MEARRKKIRNWILGVLVLALAAGAVLLPTLLGSAQQESEDGASYLSALVTRGDILSTISGGGILTQEEGTAVTVPKGVEITAYLAANGDQVTAGQPLAQVDKSSVMRTIASVQETLDYLARRLQAAAGNKTFATLRSGNYGRVKAVYAQVNDDAADVMAARGALAVISLDGLMSLEVKAEAPAQAGEAVTVTTSDGAAYAGRIERRQGDVLTVTLTDNGPRLGDSAEVTNAEGVSLGGGTLLPHSAWNVTALTGVVTQVFLREEAEIYQNSRLFQIEQVENTTEFRALASERREYEELMTELFTLYQSGVVAAPAEGCVSGLDTARVGVLREAEGAYSLVLLSETEGGDLAETPPSPDPNNTPAGTYTNKYAAVSAVTFGSITFLVQDDSAPAADYRTEPALDYTKVHAETMTSFHGVTLFAYDESVAAWQSFSPSLLREGDLLYFVYDEEGALLWIVKAVVPEAKDEPIYYGGGGGGAVEENFTKHSLEKTELGRLVPQNFMSVEVSIDELDILSVAEGQTAEVTVDALPGRSFSGAVTHIDTQGKNNGSATKYTITVTLERQSGMLQGMNATAILTVGATENVLTLPVAALSQKGSRTVVYTAYDEESRTLLAPVEIETGVSDGMTAEVRQGLSEGDRVWYAYYESGTLPSLLARLPGEDA